MHIVALVKHVPDPTEDRSFEADHTVDRRTFSGGLSPLDEYAVEEALILKEALGAHVTVLTMGPALAVEAVRKALQMGADAGIHVEDDALSGSDALATSLVLAAAMRRIGDVDLVLAGMASTDGGTSLVPAMLAERLDVAQVTFASEVTIENGVVRIRRDGDTATEIVEANLPAVVSVTDQINEPRHPSFRGISAARSKPVQRWSLADLGIAPEEVGHEAAWSTVSNVTPRPPRSDGVIVTDTGDAGEVLARFLTTHRFV